MTAKYVICLHKSEKCEHVSGMKLKWHCANCFFKLDSGQSVIQGTSKLVTLLIIYCAAFVPFSVMLILDELDSHARKCCAAATNIF